MNDPSIAYKHLSENEAFLLDNVEDGVFDDPINSKNTYAFLQDPNLHLVVALKQSRVIGFISAVSYFHPDKLAPELWINEVGVAPSHQGQGIGKGLLAKTLEIGRELGCSQAWVLTDRANEPANRLYGTFTKETPSDQVLFEFDLEI